MIQEKILDRDLSPKALKTAVYKESAQSPLTLYCSSTAALSAFYLLLIGLNPIALGGLAIGGGVAVGSWVWNSIVKRDARAAAIIMKYRKQIEKERYEAIGSLREELLALGDHDAIKQIELFQEKFVNFTHILGKKFRSEELTYNRYLSIAEQVYLGGVANLEKASIAQRSVKAIDRTHISNQLDLMVANEDHETIASLKQRISLLEEQQEKAHDLKKRNEIAMTQLDAVSARIADLDTSSPKNTIDLDDAMDELRYLIARAESYSNQS